MLLSLLASSGAIPSTPYWTSANIADGIQAVLINFEMLGASIFHIWAFSASEYESTHPGAHTAWWKAVMRCFNPMDIVREVDFGVAHLVQSVGGGKGRGKGDGEVGIPMTSTTYEEEVADEGYVPGEVEERVPVVKAGAGYGTNA
ncbi:hypothetical protein HDU98_003125 [Podochytrium sp. JEL0797]|nr:hypothetical protein HDU98_003125 [Podochytrium sp. JEL0797]